MVWLIGVEEGWMGVLHGEGGAAAMAEAAVFWASWGEVGQQGFAEKKQRRVEQLVWGSIPAMDG